MNSKNNNLPQVNREEMDIKLSTIERANTTSVLMAQLCKELGLEPQKTTHSQFVEAFSNLQKQSLEYQKDLQEMYISSSKVKPKQVRTRKTQVQRELEAWEEFPEKTDTFSNGDYK